MFKFRDFMNTLGNFAKSVITCIFAKFKYQMNGGEAAPWTTFLSYSVKVCGLLMP